MDVEIEVDILRKGRGRGSPSTKVGIQLSIGCYRAQPRCGVVSLLLDTYYVGLSRLMPWKRGGPSTRRRLEIDVPYTTEFIISTFTRIALQHSNFRFKRILGSQSTTTSPIPRKVTDRVQQRVLLNLVCHLHTLMPEVTSL